MSSMLRWVAVWCFALAACEPPRMPEPDAGGADAGSADAAVDAAVADAGRDGGADAGVDAGLPRLEDGGLAPLVIPRSLSGLKLFAEVPIVDGEVQPAPDLVPYALATPLFSDYSLKSRSLRIPEGAASWSDDDLLVFPVGTVITKSFSYPADFRRPTENRKVLETRLLVRQPTGWEAFPFVWDDAQREATYAPGGRVFPLSFIDADGGTVRTQYLVPSKNQCLECHHLNLDGGSDQTLEPIGPKARNLNFDYPVRGVTQNQLERLAALGKLTGLPPAAQRPRAIDAFDPDGGTLEARARAYLDVNCAHCHRPDGTAGQTSQLFLNVQNENRFNLGECKRPGSAGNDVGGAFDIVPGDHSTSILWFRLQTTESGKMMPVLGRSLRHEEGAALIQEWIDSLPPRNCMP